MEDINENMEGITEKFTGGDYSIPIKCPKCKSEEVIVEEDEEGYFYVLKCNKCGYSKSKKEDRKED